MSDKIAVMYAGRVQQFATPNEIYERPASRFVAEFIGATSFLKGTVLEAAPGNVQVRLPDGSTLRAARGEAHVQPGAEVSVAIRSERAQVTADGRGDNIILGHITASDYLGSKWQHTVETKAGVMKIETLDHAAGAVRVYLPPDALIVLAE
jgi:ABC-type Fe3+/spermidine/putrescine transport system ATPase subunit